MQGMQQSQTAANPRHQLWEINCHYKMDRVKRIWYLSPVRAAKVQASLRIRAVSPEPSLLAHTSSESRGTFRPSDRKPDPWPLWMAGHAQLKFVMSECSKTQIRLTRLKWISNFETVIDLRQGRRCGAKTDQQSATVSLFPDIASFHHGLVWLFKSHLKSSVDALSSHVCFVHTFRQNNSVYTPDKIYKELLKPRVHDAIVSCLDTT